MDIRPNDTPRQYKPLTILGLETSCDETAAAVVHLDAQGQAHYLADQIYSQIDEHSLYGGVVPEIAARAHVGALDALIERALVEADITFDDLDGVAATTGPGLVGGVMVGMMSAKAIALAHDIPFLPINHLEGHALSPLLAQQDGEASLAFPYLLLLVSGGHTQLLSVEGLGRYTRLGSTIDDAVGEAFDKSAKIMELGFPGGPALERATQKGDASRFSLPRPLKGKPGCDFSFAGLKSAVRRAWENLPERNTQARADLAAAFQEAATDVLADRANHAMKTFAKTHGPRTLVVAGGVAANRALRTRLIEEAEKNGFSFSAPPLALCTDNGGMIAYAGALHMRAGHTGNLAISARPRWPLDEQAAKTKPASGSGKKGPKS
jgi:tRNA N6-adenosine threonylcarbamoyltransferase